MLAASGDTQALVSMTVGYLILMSALALGLWRLYRPAAQRAGPAASPGPDSAGSRPRGGWVTLAWHVTGTAAGGYVLLMTVVVAFYYGVSQVGPRFLTDAATGTALLIGLAAPVFAAASWLDIRRTQRRGRLQGAGELLPGQERGMPRHPLVGYLCWAVLFAAIFAWEGLALAGARGVPSISDVVRVIMRYPAARWALFIVWLWAGWAGFVRRWHFLLRGRDAGRAVHDPAAKS
jgi:hypothetical protein